MRSLTQKHILRQVRGQVPLQTRVRLLGGKYRTCCWVSPAKSVFVSGSTNQVMFSSRTATESCHAVARFMP